MVELACAGYQSCVTEALQQAGPSKKPFTLRPHDFKAALAFPHALPTAFTAPLPPLTLLLQQLKS